jgi:hypothetical protein
VEVYAYACQVSRRGVFIQLPLEVNWAPWCDMETPDPTPSD